MDHKFNSPLETSLVKIQVSYASIYIASL